MREFTKRNLQNKQPRIFNRNFLSVLLFGNFLFFAKKKKKDFLLKRFLTNRKCLANSQSIGL